MKALNLTFLVLFLSTSSSFSQAPLNFKPQNPTFFFLNGQGGVAFDLEQNSRYNNFFYNDFRQGDLQVISVYQPAVQQDLVYYIDKDGNTHYRSFAMSHPINLMTPQGTRDSLNPYGARDLGESLLTGLLNTFFRDKRFLRFKAQ